MRKKRKLTVALLAMAILTSLLSVTPVAAAPNRNPMPSQYAAPNQSSAEQSTSEGSGFSIQTVPADAVASDLALTSRAKSMLGDTVRLVTVTTLRGLREAGLPEWSQLDELSDHGYGSWAEVPATKLDEPIDPVVINLDMLIDITPEVEELMAGGPYPQSRISCEKTRRGGITLNERIDLKNFFDVDVPDLPEDIEASVDATLAGELEIIGHANYTYKTVRSICSIVGGIILLGPWGALPGYAAAQVPYKWKLADSNLTGRLIVDGTLGAGGTVSKTYRREIWNYHRDLADKNISLPLIEGVTLDIALGLDLDLALTFQATVSASAAAEFDQDWAINGSADVSWACQGTSCDITDKSMDIDFDETGPVRTQRSLDLRIIPSADLNLDFDLDIGVAGLKLYDIGKGSFGIVAQLPARYFWTDGNDCSDANGDGTYERVQTQLVDLNLEVFGYVQGSLFDAGVHQFLTFTMPPRFKKKLDKPLWRFNKTVPMYEKNIYFRDLSPTGANTALQPVIGNAGTWVTDAGIMRTGVEILGTRDCYPLTAEPTFQIDWGDGSPYVTAKAGLVSHLHPRVGGYNVRVRLISDEAGRVFRSGGWVSKNVQGGAMTRPTTPPNVRASVYSSSSGEIMWDAATDNNRVVGYRVIRNGVDLGVIDGRSHYEAALPTGQYRYEIYAIDDQGAPSFRPARVVLDLTTNGQQPGANPPSTDGAPTTPSNLRAARYSSSSGEIMWDRSSDSDGRVVGYRIVRNGVDLGTPDATSRYEPNLSPGTYRYEVYAVDDDGNRSPAATVTLTI